MGIASGAGTAHEHIGFLRRRHADDNWSPPPRPSAQRTRRRLDAVPCGRDGSGDRRCRTDPAVRRARIRGGVGARSRGQLPGHLRGRHIGRGAGHGPRFRRRHRRRRDRAAAHARSHAPRRHRACGCRCTACPAVRDERQPRPHPHRRGNPGRPVVLRPVGVAEDRVGHRPRGRHSRRHVGRRRAGHRCRRLAPGPHRPARRRHLGAGRLRRPHRPERARHRDGRHRRGRRQQRRRRRRCRVQGRQGHASHCARSRRHRPGQRHHRRCRLRGRPRRRCHPDVVLEPRLLAGAAGRARLRLVRRRRPGRCHGQRRCLDAYLPGRLDRCRGRLGDQRVGRARVVVQLRQPTLSSPRPASAS